MPVTALLGGLYALMMVGLSLPVSMRRRELAVAYGDASDPVLRARIRAHGNFIEYAPLGLMVLALTEIAEAPLWFVWPLAAAFLFARVFHALGMLVFYSNPLMRGAGMLLQHLAFLAGGVWLLTQWRL